MKFLFYYECARQAGFHVAPEHGPPSAILSRRNGGSRRMQQSRADRSPRNGRQSGSSHVAASTTDKPAKPARHRERVHIGTSGWHYKHWVGSFYPEGMQDVAFLGWYADHFPT